MGTATRSVTALAKTQFQKTAVFTVSLAVAFWWVTRNIRLLTSDWPIKSPDQLLPHQLVALFSIPLLALLVTSLFVVGPRLMRRALSDASTRLAMLIGSCIFIAHGTVLLGLAPGLWPEDAIYTNHMVRAGWWSGWYSPLHPFLVTLVMHWIPSATGLTAVLAASVGGLIGLTAFVALRLGASNIAVVVICLVAAVMPSTFFNALMPIRDSFFTVFFLLFCLAAFWLCVKQELTFPRLLALGLLGGILASYRTDALPAAVFAPLLIVPLARSGPKRCAALSIAYFLPLLLTLSALAAVPSILGKAWDARAEREYKLTLIANPLGYLVKTGFISADPVGDKKAIERVFNYEDLAKHWYPYNIAIFYRGHWNQSSTDEERHEAFNVAVSLFVNNPGRFLESRVLSFVPASGLAPNEPVFHHTRENVAKGLVTAPEPVASVKSIANAVESWLQETQEFKGVVLTGRFLYWNLSIWLVVLFVVAFFWRSVPGAAVFSALLLLRAGAVFVGAPSTFVHYYFSVFLGGVLVLALALGELSFRGTVHQYDQDQNPPELR